MKTLAEIDAKIAELQAERERIANGGVVDGDTVWRLDPYGEIIDSELEYNDEYEHDMLARGRIARTREELEAKDRRDVIETQLLKYADWECDDPVVLYYDLRTKDVAYGWLSDRYGVILMSEHSAISCIAEMNHDDLKFYLTWGQG